MLERFKLNILLQSLTLFLLGPACQASSLGLTVNVVPLDINGGNTVEAYFSAITPIPCPDLSGLCAVGEDCQVYTTSQPFTGTKPDPGWCVRQWQKTVPSNYTSTIKLGSTEMYVSLKAGPIVRANSGRLNQPAFVALPPPLRALVKCPRNFYLSVKDLDGDKVRCRFASPEQGECLTCTQHPFIKLDEGKCMLTFTGEAPAGQYFIYLMAEDLIPVPMIRHFTKNKPLSSVPVQLSLTVEKSNSICNGEPVTTGETPKMGSMLFVLPYQEVQFTINFGSQLESVLEVAVVGPPELYRVGFTSIASQATITIAWIRTENQLTRLLPICFAANSKSLQSEPRCVWLFQREMMVLPDGTELKCDNKEMTLVLPVSSLTNINLAELQLNSPTCPVTYNSTHLTAHISLNGCGTKIVQSGSELVYTNTLQSVRPYTTVSRLPSLILPLACRIPGVQAKGPLYNISMPKEVEIFGEVRYWIEIYLPGQGPAANSTRFLRFLPQRMRREAGLPSESNSTSTSSFNSTSTSSINSTSTSSINSSTTSSPNTPSSPSATTSNAIGSKINQLDIYVLSNCSIGGAQMIVSNCINSNTSDFAVTVPILNQGCVASNSTLEVVTSQTNIKIFRLDLNSVQIQGSTMYVQCTVSLCIATMPSVKCPDLCTTTLNQTTVVSTLFTSSYTVRSGPISLVVTTPAPLTTSVSTTPTTTTTTTPTTTTTTTTATTSTTTTTTTTTPTTTATSLTTTTPAQCTSHAPEHASAMAAGVILTTINILFQNIFVY